ncbi:MAG: signal peptide peptidase SppA [Candidatus Paracaedibacteraceae bacterium]|nr:signal peptide peptidase SppA [Candidatus Paracaedibacteraceae bacterium]
MLKFIRRALGLIFSTIGFVVVVVLIIGYMKFVRTAQMDPDSDPITDHSVLQLEVGGLPIKDFNLPTSILSQLQKYRTQSLVEIVELVNEATIDPRIKAISLSIIGTAMSAAQAEELRTALEDFRKAGKKIYAFAYAFGDGSNGTSSYYLASIADKVYMQPHGAVSVIGASLESFFLKNLLDEFDITVQAARRNEQKGVIDKFTRADFTPEVKENLYSVISSILSHIQETTAKGRGLDKETYVTLMNTAPHPDQQALQVKLLDELIYRDQVRDKIKVELGDKVAFVTEKGYSPQNKRPQSKNKIGIIFLESEVPPSGSTALNLNDPYAPESLDKSFEMATRDPEVKAIVFRVNTPGGAVSGAETIYRAVKRTVDKGIPVIISMGSVAASAGYYMAAPATKIYANATTLTGSIGIAMAKPNIGKATENYGITWDRVQIGTNAGMWSMTQDFNEAAWKKVQESLDDFYTNFTQTVAEGRKLPLEKVKSIAGGQVWSGIQAKENGLVDEIGGFFSALNEAKKIANVANTEDPNIVIFNRVNVGLPLLFSLLSEESIAMIKQAIGMKTEFNHVTATNRVRLVM